MAKNHALTVSIFTYEEISYSREGRDIKTC